MAVSSTARRITLSICSGVLSGVAASLFLHAISWATRTRQSTPDLLYALPIAGLLIGGLYERFGGRASRGTDLILDEIHRPTNRTPGRMTPLAFGASVLSHLFGASTGREGVAVQMGASLSDQLSRYLKLSEEDRRLLLMTGSAGGFSAGLGAPFAGMVFGMEVLTKKLRFKLEYPIECAISAATAFLITHLFHVSHTHYGSVPLSITGVASLFPMLLAAIVIGFAIGAAVRLFFHATDGFSEIFRLAFQTTGARAFVSGLMIIALVALLGNRLSLGLGIESIQSAFLIPSPVSLAFEKILFTAVSLGGGFKGGEFIPLIFIGATLGSSLAPLLSFLGAGVSTAFAAGCGTVVAYGAAARVPFALSVFAAEKFSVAFSPFALLSCLCALLISGRHSSLFSSQRD